MKGDLVQTGSLNGVVLPLNSVVEKILTMDNMRKNSFHITSIHLPYYKSGESISPDGSLSLCMGGVVWGNKEVYDLLGFSSRLGKPSLRMEDESLELDAKGKRI